MTVWLVWWRKETPPVVPCDPWELHSIHARKESAMACGASLHLHEVSVCEEGVEP